MTELFNIKLNLLYKQTEQKYKNDVDVDEEDVSFLCDELYRYELLQAFCLNHDELDKLTYKVEKLYNIIKKEEKIIALIKENRFDDDDCTIFMTLFSYDHFYIIYPIIVSLLDKQIE